MTKAPDYIIGEEDVQALEGIAKRLYSEDRLSGDQMRNMAQTLDSVIRIVRSFPVEE